MQADNPIIICYGNEFFLRDEYVTALIDRWIDPILKDFSVIRFDLAETTLDAVIDEAETAPFMVEKKIVIARGALFLTGAKDSSKVEHRPERLLTYMKAPADFSIVILLVDAEKLDERKKIVKALKELKCLKSFQSLSADDLPEWAQGRARKLGFTFEQDALERFILYTGGQLQAMSSELAKLLLYAGSEKSVTVGMVEAMVVRGTEQNVFILMEDIVQKRMERAFDILYDLLKQREEPIKLIMLMARQFRLILQVKDLLGQGYSQQQIATQVGSHPYPIKLAAEQGRKYEIERLKTILTDIADLDYHIKSGRVEKVLGLEMLLLKLAQ
ncbi:MAG: DNA polymerase III subunit delta [Gorillibacterium sp.]|nr:DNA polymerase III subunit delta [Gorillibacterium sp.]